MPRVSEEHLERRREQILDAALACFARQGFHETSMQDIFTESGLSAGAVYRYFKGKNELIAALIAQNTVGLREAIGAAVHSDPLPTPAQLLGTLAKGVESGAVVNGPIRLAPQAWAQAVVDPDARVMVASLLIGMRDLWAIYAGRMRDAGWLAPDADLDAVAAVIVGIMPGFILQHLIAGDVDADVLARGITALFPPGVAT